jgi:glycosyltransferase involved in cell wall biosynthesis
MSGTLILTSHGGCFPESGGPGAFYADPLNEEEIAALMLAMATLSPAEKAYRQQQGRDHCRQFHWKVVTEKLLSHYQGLLQG